MNELIKNEKNKTKAEILVEKLNELSYGDFISHEQIATLIEEPYGTNKYTSVIAKAKKLLKHYKRGFNEMKKGYEVLEYAPTKNMTKEGRDAYRRVHDRAITLAAAMKGASVELKTLGQKKHPFAIENMQNN